MRFISFLFVTRRQIHPLVPIVLCSCHLETVIAQITLFILKEFRRRRLSICLSISICSGLDVPVTTTAF